MSVYLTAGVDSLLSPLLAIAINKTSQRLFQAWGQVTAQNGCVPKVTVSSCLWTSWCGRLMEPSASLKATAADRKLHGATWAPLLWEWHGLWLLAAASGVVGGGLCTPTQPLVRCLLLVNLACEHCVSCRLPLCPACSASSAVLSDVRSHLQCMSPFSSPVSSGQEDWLLEELWNKYQLT